MKMKTLPRALMMRCCGPMPCGKYKPQNPPERTCVGPDCMAWRWGDPDDNGHGEERGWCALTRKPQ